LGDSESPSVAGDVPVGGPVIALATGGYHTCAILSTFQVKCWGRNNNGQLGYGMTTTIGDNEPASSIGTVNVGGETVSSIAAGDDVTCAILSSGRVLCWGHDGGTGVLGQGNIPGSIGDDELPGFYPPIQLW
jgi:alpha-tubulin suppressor-like RCC1 family protein